MYVTKNVHIFFMFDKSSHLSISEWLFSVAGAAESISSSNNSAKILPNLKSSLITYNKSRRSCFVPKIPSSKITCGFNFNSTICAVHCTVKSGNFAVGEVISPSAKKFFGADGLVLSSPREKWKKGNKL